MEKGGNLSLGLNVLVKIVDPKPMKRAPLLSGIFVGHVCSPVLLEISGILPKDPWLTPLEPLLTRFGL